MAFSKGKDSVSLKEILDRVTEADILSYYLFVDFTKPIQGYIYFEKNGSP